MSPGAGCGGSKGTGCGGGCSSSSAIEYTVRVPKNSTKKYNIMAFNMGDKVDCSTWTRARMERDMSARRMYGEEDNHGGEGGAGAGPASELGKKQQWQESRRRKYGVVAREFKADDQPWVLRVNGKAGRKFKGQKKSGVTENTCYYVFTQQSAAAAGDGNGNAFEAFPVHGWYNFAPLAKHRTLTMEEAEEEWGRRNKVVDHFNIMLQRRLREKGGTGGEGEEEGDGKADKKKKKDEGGDYLDYHGPRDPSYSDSDSDGSMGGEGRGSKVKRARTGNKGKAGKKSKGSDNEAKEDSDDGDYEGLEVDYMSDRSSSDEEPGEKGKPDKGEEDVPRGIDEASESEEESEEEQNEEEGKEEEEEEEEEGKMTERDGEKKDNNGDSSDDSDIEGWAASALFLVKKLPPPKRRGSALTASRPGTSSIDSTASKLEQGQLQGVVTYTPLAKKQRMEPTCQSPAAFGKGTVPQPGKSTPSSGDTQLTEDAVRRYLIRKPMSTKDLLKKFQTKRTGLSNEQTVNSLAQILKRLNPERKNVNDKMLLYLKE